MKPPSFLVCLLLFLAHSLVTSDGWVVPDVTSGFAEFRDSVASLSNRMSVLTASLTQLARQVMQQQYAAEEKIRNDGNSGIKQMRHDGKGPHNFYEASHTGKTTIGIHDHADHKYTVGAGEIAVVLNGVEFRTRHNDYMLRRPSTTSDEYDAVEMVEFPDVPEEVSSQSDLNGQILELREWFRAFAEQNVTHRNYTKYFKPHMCYLEGAWTTDQNISEPFQSDRHFIDATSWFDLMDKVRFASISGAKNILENLAYLPTTIVQVDDDTGYIGYAQWNYRIMCYPVHKDIPTRFLRPLDDLGNRLARKRSWETHLNSRGCRFELYEHDVDQLTEYTLLDEIFSKIPGKDNNPTWEMTEEFSEPIFDAADKDGLTRLNTAYYHRLYKFGRPGAMGTMVVNRGFGDNHMWVASNKQSRVAPFRQCVNIDHVRVHGVRKEVCLEYSYHRYSYAIPLELMYLTPLYNWNPHQVEYFTNKEDMFGTDNRDGSASKPFKGIAQDEFYQTPHEFYSDQALADATEADTSKYTVTVEDHTGTGRTMRSSGPRIFTEKIDGGVGRVRLRYPIAPIHGEGSGVWKELNALRQVVTDAKIYDGNSNMIKFQMAAAPDDDHTHEVYVHKEAVIAIIRGSGISTTSEVSHNHRHDLRINYNSDEEFHYKTCDDRTICFDRHPTALSPLIDLTYLVDEVLNN